jgi:glucan phosphoethanolaminetransferase (alkaline phosphatase superfamily)
MGVRRRGEVAYLTAVFILVVAAVAASGMLIFKLYDRAVQLYDQTGDEKAVRLVKLGIAMWLIMVLSTALWLIIVTSERRSRREASTCCGHSCDCRRLGGAGVGVGAGNKAVLRLKIRRPRAGGWLPWFF